MTNLSLLTRAVCLLAVVAALAFLPACSCGTCSDSNHTTAQTAAKDGKDMPPPTRTSGPHQGN